MTSSPESPRSPETAAAQGAARPGSPAQSGSSGRPASSGQPASSRGAVDLAGLGGAAAQTQGAGGGAPGRWSVDVDEALFQELVQLSTRVPVILAVTNSRVPGGDTLRDDLVRVVEEQQGRLVLGLVDPDAQPRVAQALQVQQIPAVLAVLGGRPMPLFVGVVEEEQLTALVQELHGVAVQQGMAGTVPPLNNPEEGEAPSRFAEAEDLVAAGDHESAAALYEEALRQNPGDDDASVGLHRVRLLQRVQGMDAAQVRTAAAERTEDLQAQLDVADLDVVGGHVEDAFARLIGFIGRHRDDDREPARAHLVELFGVVGHSDPRVTKARGRLATTLF